MTLKELKSKLNDVALNNNTISQIIKEFLTNGSVDVYTFSLMSDKKSNNFTPSYKDNGHLLSNKVVLFKTIIKKMSSMDIERFKEYGFNNDILNKLLKLNDMQIIAIFKGKVPKEFSWLSPAINTIVDMSLIDDYSGGTKADVFEEKIMESVRGSYKVKYNKKIYLNIPYNKYGIEFLTIFKLKCIEKGLPSKMKGVTENKSGSTIIYTNDYYLLDQLNILEDLIESRKDLSSKFGYPVMSGARVKAKDEKTYYTVSSGLICEKTPPAFYNALFSIAFSLLCSRYYEKKPISIDELKKYTQEEKNNYINGYKNRLLKDLKAKRKSIDEIISDYKYVIRIVASYLKFGDYNHLNVPLYQDQMFIDYINSDSKEESINFDDEKDLYLYHTDDLINDILSLFPDNTDNLVPYILGYLTKMNEIYKKYLYYSSKEAGFVFKERHRRLLNVFNELLTSYKVPEKPDNNSLNEYYLAVFNGVSEYKKKRNKLL